MCTGSQVEGRRITIEVQSSKDVASVTVDGTKVRFMVQINIVIIPICHCHHSTACIVRLVWCLSVEQEVVYLSQLQ